LTSLEVPVTCCAPLQRERCSPTITNNTTLRQLEASMRALYARAQFMNQAADGYSAEEQIQRGVECLSKSVRPRPLDLDKSQAFANEHPVT